MNRQCFSFLISAVLSFSFLTGCTKIDNWMEGEDNLEKPKTLAQIDSKLHVKKGWQHSTGHIYPSRHLKLSPVKVDHLIISADEDGSVAALNQQTGQIVWRIVLRDKVKRQGINSGLSIQGQQLVLTTTDGKLVSLNKNNGVKQWEVALPHEVLATPTLTKDKAIVKTIDDKVIAFNLSTGAQLWQYDHGHVSFGLRANSAPQVADNKVIVGFQDGKLEVLELASGRLIWQRTISIPKGISQADRVTGLVADPIIANGVIYVPSYQGAVTAIELTNGREIWQQPMSVYAGIALDSARVYAADTRGHVWALDRQNGRVLWKQEELHARKLTKPVLLGNAVVVGDHEGHMHFLSRTEGHFLGRVTVSTKTIVVPPLVEGSHIYVLAQDGTLTNYLVK